MMNDFTHYDYVEDVAKFHRIYVSGAPGEDAITLFRSIIYGYYREHKRIFPWRGTKDPYRILVSEIMLQQTQTSRVIDKYNQFIEVFPDIAALHSASLTEVLSVWRGLGYNRRAVALKRIAETVMTSFAGAIPSSPEALIQLPGIGSYTASAIAAFAFGKPTVLVETNVRTVYMLFFFAAATKVADREIIPLVEQTLDRGNVSDWYYALFDYGAMLKQVIKLNEKSAHYRKQQSFRGSSRQLRGEILRLVLDNPSILQGEIIKYLERDLAQITGILEQLAREGFIIMERGSIYMAG